MVIYKQSKKGQKMYQLKNPKVKEDKDLSLLRCYAT